MRLTNREMIGATAGFVIALVLVGGGLWWHSYEQHKKALNNARQAAQAADSGSSSLSVGVGAGGASDLGQLGGSGSNQSQQGQNGSNSSSGSSGVDPSTFSQYSKYQNNKDALFGDIQKGNGATLTSGKQANVYYKGWLTNGALIDQSPVSSSGQPQPFNFTMGAHQVIPGWEEGLYGMQAGGSRLVIIPPAVGYGSQAHGPIPANSVLVFEVQLISVQ